VWNKLHYSCKRKKIIDLGHWFTTNACTLLSVITASISNPRHRASFLLGVSFTRVYAYSSSLWLQWDCYCDITFPTHYWFWATFGYKSPKHFTVYL